MKYKTILTMVIVCVVSCETEDETPIDVDGKADVFGPDGLSSFQDHPFFVVRDRLDIAGSDGHHVASTGQAFSHRSRRWHVYPFTSYGSSTFHFQLRVNDSLMNDKSVVWVFGPRQSDGSWGDPRLVVSDDGEATLDIDASGYGQYAAVVGPPEGEDFLPRFPACIAIVCQDSCQETHAAHMTLDQAASGAINASMSVSGGDFTFPQPTTVSVTELAPGDHFNVVDENGQEHEFELVSWSRSSYFMPDYGLDYMDSILGNLHQDVLSLNPTSDLEDEENYHVMSAVGVRGRPDDLDPVFLEVVPVEIDGRVIEAHDVEGCNEGTCRGARFVDTGEPIPDDEIRHFRPTFHDFDEVSTYDLDVSCEGSCAPRTGPTRYPIYFGHGFNSSSEAWENVREALGERDPIWNEWIWAENVPGFEPVENRSEQLRRNLATFLGRLEDASIYPPDGEPFQRLNIIAHSMAGLDSRYLLGNEKYNNDRCHELEECTTAEGNPEPCCLADLDGNAIQWNQRIASVTTLSTPHCGSSFATWAIEQIESELYGNHFRRIANGIFGVDPEAGGELLEETLYALSGRFCEDVMRDHYPARPERNYVWECATGQQSCDEAAPGADHGPREDPERSGQYLLPERDDSPTIFAWAGHACLTGNCGDTVAPALVASFAIVSGREGKNDGVVAIDSATFGIFMGIRPTDHFHWNRFSYSGLARLAGSIFGVKREPVDRFYTYWFDELRRAGY